MPAFFALLFEWLIKFLMSIMKLDPEEVSVAEAARLVKGKKFRDWFAKQK